MPDGAKNNAPGSEGAPGAFLDGSGWGPSQRRIHWGDRECVRVGFTYLSTGKTHLILIKLAQMSRMQK